MSTKTDTMGTFNPPILIKGIWVYHLTYPAPHPDMYSGDNYTIRRGSIHRQYPKI